MGSQRCTIHNVQNKIKITQHAKKQENMTHNQEKITKEDMYIGINKYFKVLEMSMILKSMNIINK